MRKSGAGFDGCSKHGKQFAAILVHGLIQIVWDIRAAVQQFQPVQGFCTLFFCDIQLGNEILAAASVDCFCNVCTDAGTASKNLLGHDIFLLVPTQKLIQFYDALGKSHAFCFQNAVNGHGWKPLCREVRDIRQNISYLLSYITYFPLVVEQAHAGEGHDHIVLVTFCDDQIVTDGAAGLGDVLDAGGASALDVVREGEEGIAAQGYAAAGSQESLLFFFRQLLGLNGEVILPDALSADVLFVAVDVAVDDVVAVGAAQVLAELQAQGLGMLTQEPGICLGACQTGAMG